MPVAYIHFIYFTPTQHTDMIKGEDIYIFFVRCSTYTRHSFSTMLATKLWNGELSVLCERYQFKSPEVNGDRGTFGVGLEFCLLEVRLGDGEFWIVIENVMLLVTRCDGCKRRWGD